MIILIRKSKEYRIAIVGFILFFIGIIWMILEGCDFDTILTVFIFQFVGVEFFILNSIKNTTKELNEFKAILSEQIDPQKLITVLDQKPELKKEDFLFLYADAYQLKGDLEKALEIVEKIIPKSKSEKFYYHNYLSVYYINKHQYDEAERHYTLMNDVLNSMWFKNIMIKIAKPNLDKLKMRIEFQTNQIKDEAYIEFLEKHLYTKKQSKLSRLMAHYELSMLYLKRQEMEKAIFHKGWIDHLAKKTYMSKALDELFKERAL